jgi:hypothetical protein
MINYVQGLVTSGELNGQYGADLIPDLEVANAYLNSGDPNSAIFELKHFISQTKLDINDGVLSSTNGQTLIDAANDIINSLSNQVL